MWVTASVNDKVKIKLLEKGKDIIARENFNHKYKNPGASDRFVVDTEDCIEMIMHEFMTYFVCTMIVWQEGYYEPVFFLDVGGNQYYGQASTGKIAQMPRMSPPEGWQS